MTAALLVDIRPRQGDPTGTSGLRRSFRAAAKLRLRQLRSQLRIAVMERDILGFSGALTNAASMQPADVRLKALNGWLESMAPQMLGGPWLSQWVAKAWRSGAEVAIEQVGDTELEEGSGALLTLAQAELEGITAATVQQLTREAARALAHARMKRTTVWQRLARVFDKVAEPRLCALANTITVAAHNHGRGAVYREAGYDKVGIVPEHAPPMRTDAMFARDKRAEPELTAEEELQAPSRAALQREYEETTVGILTAGDDNVCQECEDYAADSPHDIDDALDTLPMHVGCRCTIYPWEDERFKGEDYDPNQPRAASAPGHSGGEFASYEGGGESEAQRGGFSSTVRNYGTVPGHVEKFNQLKNKWAQLNNEALERGFIDHPDSPDARAMLGEMESIVKEVHGLRADPGGPEGIGLPGGPRDVTIIGAGPGGLSAGINGAAEGYDTLIVEANAVPGGASKYSSRIENYGGFPIGASGERISQGLFDQAKRLGAEAKLGVRVTGMTYNPNTGLKHLTLSNGETIDTRTVVVASGLEIKKLPPFPGSEGPGLVYADPKELSKVARGGAVAVIGGSNGAAQAALGCARDCDHVYLLSRSPIVDGMSDYVVRTVRNNPKITVLEGEKEEMVKLERDEHGNVRMMETNKGRKLSVNAIGLFVGSVPKTDWLANVEKDKAGKIVTDRHYETKVPGVYAVGDVRAEAINRVGVAYGEGQFALGEISRVLHKLKAGQKDSLYRDADGSDDARILALITDLFDLDRANPWFGQMIEGEKPKRTHDYNQLHEPEGSSIGGQFASAGVSSAEESEFERWGGAAHGEHVAPAQAAKVKELAGKTPGLKKLLPYMAPDEVNRIKKVNVNNLVEVFTKFPVESEEMAAVAFSGRAKQGWYRKSAKAVVDVFGAVDAPRFAALMASLSPQSSVESNAINALNSWVNWSKAGRPIDRESIIKVLGQSVQGGKGVESVLPAWINNAVTSLSTVDPEGIVLSGPKVDSFAENLRGHVNAVTNDTWMANYLGVEQAQFARRTPVPGQYSGKGPFYIATAAATRKAAEILTEKTGTKWTPAEIQETIWSWAKTLYERASADKTTIEQLLKAGSVTHKDIADTPDFAILFTQNVYRKILEGGGYGKQAAALGGAGKPDGPAGSGSNLLEAEGSGIAQDAFTRFLFRAAKRLDVVRAERARRKAENVDASETHAQYSLDFNWDPDKHPRGQPENKGRFGVGGGGKEVEPEHPKPIPEHTKPTSENVKAAGAKIEQGFKEATSKGKHPGKGYSKEAIEANGVIHTSNIEDAARALYEKKKVQLDQPVQVATLIDHLGKVAETMIKLGGKAPVFNLCDVTVANTNLFCVESKGIPRVQMPQLTDEQTVAFRAQMKLKYGVEDGEELAAHLRATQDELNGAKVANAAKLIETNEQYAQRRIIISRDNYVLDGHHFWAGKLGLDARDGVLTNDTKVNITRIDVGITKLLEEADNFTEGKGKVGVGQDPTYGKAPEGSVTSKKTKDSFDPSQPRDPDGKWTPVGGDDDDLGSMALGGAERHITPATRKVDALRATKDIPFEQRQALDMYTQDSSSHFNNLVRGGSGDAVPPEIRQLDKLVEGHTLPSDLTVYRTVGWQRTQSLLDNVGGTFSDPAFMSTTLDKSKVEKPGSYIEIQVPKGSRGFPVGSLSNYQEEAEILFPRNSRLQLISHEKRTDNTERFVARLVP